MKYQLKHPRWLYYISAFVTGLSVMAVEMNGARLLAPSFGNSIFVWTNLIGLILLALSAGYYLGGVWADKRQDPQLYFLLLLFTALWVLVLPFVSPLVFENLKFVFQNLYQFMIWGSFISVLFLFVFPVFVLGMITPYTLKLLTANLGELGRDAGRVSAASTVGSIIGTFLPAFILIPLFGTMNSFVVVGLLLLTVAGLGLRSFWIWLFWLLTWTLFFLTPPVYASENLLDQKDSPYGFIFVKERAGRHELFVDNSFGMQSVYDPDQILTDQYYSYFATLPARIDDAESVLILGHAGGTFSRIFQGYYPELSITAVELDPAVTAMAEEWMGLDAQSIELIHGDARAFLNSTDQKFDLIIMDAYHLLSVPSHLATVEFFSLANEHLNEGGIFAMNALSHDSVFLTRLENTLLSVFPELREFSIPTSANTMLSAGGPSAEGAERDWSDFHPDFAIFVEKIQKNEESVSFIPDYEIFTDDKSTAVDLETQALLKDLFSWNVPRSVLD